jgi:hypothetical protein
MHCKVHQHSNGPGSPDDQAIGKSRGGLNSKIHLIVDVLGRLAAPIVVTPGNVSDITVAPVLLEDLEDTAVVGDKGKRHAAYHLTYAAFCFWAMAQAAGVRVWISLRAVNGRRCRMSWR